MLISRPFQPLFLLAALALAAPALAQDNGGNRSPAAQPAPPDTLIINAVSYAPLEPRATPVTVRLYDDSAENVTLKTRLEDALRDDGWTVRDSGGPLLISFDLSTGDMGDPREHSGILRLEGSSGSSVEGDYKARLNLYSTSESSLLAGPDAPSDSPVTRPTVRYQLDINDSRNGQRLWSGWASTTLRSVQTAEAAHAMIPPLVASIGQTVRNRSLSLRSQ